MRLAIDFDGTIADSASLVARYVREVLALEGPSGAAGERRGEISFVQLTEGQHEEVTRAVFGTAFALEMEPMPGALDVLRRLGDRHELYIVTARHDYEVVYASQWLEDRGVEVRELVHTSRLPKLEACQRLAADVLFEDSPHYLAALAGLTSVRPVLLETSYNLEHPRGADWHVVPHWDAFEALCADLEGRERG